jgi:acetyltransferase-like isoleucine patch superfamily enzyme
MSRGETPVFIHPTALVEDGVVIGAGSAVWDNVHIRGPAAIGSGCIVGEKTYIAYGVAVGDGVKINAHVYLCTGVTLEDRVMIAAGVIFCNDRYPRGFDPETGALASSAPNADMLPTVVRSGATIGAGAIIGPGIEIGAFALVGMGAVVTRSVAPHAVVYGNPARQRAWACVCGHPVRLRAVRAGRAGCPRCGRLDLPGRQHATTAAIDGVAVPEPDARP